MASQLINPALKAGMGFLERDMHQQNTLRNAQVAFRNVPRSAVFFTGSQVAISEHPEGDWTTLATPGVGLRYAPYPVTPCIYYSCDTVNKAGAQFRLRVTGVDGFGNTITETTPLLETSFEVGSPVSATSVPTHFVAWLSKTFSRVTLIEYVAPDLPAGAVHTVGLGIWFWPNLEATPPTTLDPIVISVDDSGSATLEATAIFSNPAGFANNRDSYWNQGFGLPRKLRKWRMSNPASIDDYTTIHYGGPTVKGKGFADVLCGAISYIKEPDAPNILIMSAVSVLISGTTHRISTTVAHRLKVGDIVYISDSGATTDQVNGRHTVAAIIDDNSFTITTGGTGASSAAGTIFVDRLTGQRAAFGPYGGIAGSAAVGGFLIGQSAVLDEWNGDPFKIMAFHITTVRPLITIASSLSGALPVRTTEFADDYDAARDFEFWLRSTYDGMDVGSPYKAIDDITLIPSV